MKKNCFLTTLACLFALTVWSHADIMLNDFNSSGLEFTYGSWTNTGAVTTGPTFLTVQNPATESGGGGRNISTVFFDPNTSSVSLTARLGAGNQADAINVLLQDATDNEQFGYRFLTADLNSSTFTTLTRAITSFDFVNNAANSTPEFNTGGLNQYQLQGDFSTSDSLDVQFDQLAIVIPEPASISLFLAGLAGLGLARRFRKRC